MSSATASASRNLCVMSTTALPASAYARIHRSNSAASAGASTAVGSSRMSSVTSRASAFTISQRCCAPTGKSSTRAFGSSTSPARAATSRTRSAACSGSNPPCPPRAMFSATVMLGTSVKCWCTMPMPWANASDGDRIVIGAPRHRITPCCARNSPNTTRMSVVLPAPFSPSRACTLPARTCSEAPSSARTRPNVCAMPSSESSTAPVGAAVTIAWGSRSRGDHDPVGRCRNVQGSPKRVSRNAPSAWTPSVSVA